jgi:nucleotide-binding universal stress UspA family protein
MRWIIGIEVRHRTTGALRFAQWLARASEGSWADDFVGVHVLDGDHLAYVLRRRHLDEVVEEARVAAEQAVASASAGEPPPPIAVVQALTIADGLEQARVAHGADGIVVARVPRSESHHLLRLGDVSRTLLRRLASPVVVVPPAFAGAATGSGPLVALSRLNDGSVAVCEVAARVAARTGRGLAVAHVVDGRDAATGATAVERWVRRHEIPAEDCAVLRGDVIQAGLAYATEKRAVLLAVGARPHTGLRRILGATCARNLAARSNVPVLVVPERGDVVLRAAARGPAAMRLRRPDPAASH